MDKENPGTVSPEHYEAPELRALGTLAELTETNFTGTNGDYLFFGYGGTS
ncbi:MAG: lasso RiPP family leader peptide-containing protein [Acidimicrobiales bacterium]